MPYQTGYSLLLLLNEIALSNDIFHIIKIQLSLLKIGFLRI